jgi:hypothetical protein
MDDGRLSSMEVFQPPGNIKHHLQLEKKSEMRREGREPRRTTLWREGAFVFRM